jgi:AraC-like DNA-binding protein
MDTLANPMNDPAAIEPPLGATVAVELLAARWFESAGRETSPVLHALYWTIELFVTGALEIRVEPIDAPPLAWRRCGVGDGVIYAPGARYRERLAERQRNCRSVFAYVALPPNVLATGGALSRTHTWIIDPERQLSRLLTTVAEQHLGGIADMLRASAGIHEAVAMIVSGTLDGDRLRVGTGTGQEPDLLARVHRYFRDHLAGPVRLRDVARHVGVSESGLSHTYRQLAARTPMQTLQQFRLDAAMQDLRRRNDKLETIARRYGFADAFHLSRAFKRRFGVSPRQWLAGQRTADNARA